MSSPLRRVCLVNALRLIHNGDVGIFRPTTAKGRWIVRFGRHWASHVAMFVKLDGRLSMAEQTEPKGRIVGAEGYLRSLPSGTVAVYRPRWVNRYQRLKAVRWMLENVPGTPYDKKGLWRAFWSHAPFVRFWLRPNWDDESNGDRKSLYCSAAVSRAMRVGGLDPVHGLGDRWTEPGDLAKSAALVRQFEIVLSEEEVR